MAKKRTRIVVSIMLILAMVTYLSLPMSAFATVNPLAPGAVGSLNNPGDVMIEKSAQATGTENVFEVTVNIKGLDKVVPSTTTDIVLVLDKSSSMTMRNSQKLNNAQAAAVDFVNALLPSGNTQNRIGLVTFNNTALRAVELTNASGSASSGLIQAINNDNVASGTFIQDGLVKAEAMLSGSTATNKYIVVLSDGQPNFSYKGTAAAAATWTDGSSTANYKLTSFGTSVVRGSDNSYNYTYSSSQRYTVDGYEVRNHGIPTASQGRIIKNNGIDVYSIGFDIGSDAIAQWVLKNIASEDKYYGAADAAGLAAAFDAIIGSVQAAAKSAVVVDPMGDMVSYVAGSLSVSQGSADYDDATRTITWDAGDVSEAAPAVMTYKVTLNVTDPDFISGTMYPLNGATSLTYDDVTGTSRNMDYNVPQATASAQYSLTTSVIGEGTISPGSGIYEDGSVVSITCEPADGWHFAGFTTGEGYTVPENGEVTVAGDTKVEVIFEEDPHYYSYVIEYYFDDVLDGALTTTVAGIQGGTEIDEEDIDTDTNQGGYDLDFIDGLPFTIEDNDQVVKVYYVTPPDEPSYYTYEVEYYYDGVQDTSKNMTFEDILEDTEIAIEDIDTDTNKGDYDLQTVSGVPFTIIDNDQIVKVYYITRIIEPETYTLTTNVYGNGSITVDPIPGPYTSGTAITLTPVAGEGWYFDRWSDATGYTEPAAVPDSDDYTLTIIEDTVVMAIFCPEEIPDDEYTLTTSTIGNGTVFVDPEHVSYTSGSAVKVTEEAAEGWEFDHWTIGNHSDIYYTAPDDDDLVYMTDDIYVQAVFVEIEEPVFYTLTTSVIGKGYISPGPGTYEEGSVVNITVDPAKHWRFKGWTKGRGYMVPDEDGNVTINSDTKVEAIFVKRHTKPSNDDPTPPTPPTPPIIIPDEEQPAAPAVVEEPDVILDEPIPAAPLPKTGGFDPLLLYGLGALLAGGGLSLRRKQK